MTKATRRGYDFEHEIDRSLSKILDYHFKIPDARSLQWMRKGMYGDRFPAAHKVPADFVGFKGKNFYLIECKQTKGIALPFDRLREHQEVALCKAQAGGQWGLIIINFNNRQRKKAERIDRTFMIDIADWIVARHKLERASLPLKWCEDHAVELQLNHIEGYRVWELELKEFTPFGFGTYRKEA